MARIFLTSVLLVVLLVAWISARKSAPVPVPTEAVNRVASQAGSRAALAAGEMQHTDEGSEDAPRTISVSGSEAKSDFDPESRPEDSPVRTEVASDSTSSAAQRSAYAAQTEGTEDLPPEMRSAADLLAESARTLSRQLVQPGTFRSMFGEAMIGAAEVSQGGNAGVRNGSGAAQDVRNLPPAQVNTRYCESLIDSSDPGSFDAVLSEGFVPKGLILNRATGQLCGAPTEEGIFRFSIALREFSGVRKLFAFRLVVNAAVPSTEEREALSIINEDIAVASVGAEYVSRLEASGGTPPYTWSITNLPEGLELDAASGLIGGTPIDAGEFELGATLADAARSSVRKAFTLTVRTTPVFITTQSFEEGTAGTLLQLRLAAQGGVPPYTWELARSELPEGLELNPVNGTIEGTPGAEFEGTLTVRVRDSVEATDSADIPLIVHASSLRISTRSLADGFVDEPYQFFFRAEGGTAPYLWSGEVPGGLVIDPSGVLAGVPDRAGEFTIPVRLEDAKKMTSTRTFRLRIEALEQPETTPTPEPMPDPGTNPDPDTSGSDESPTPTPPPRLPGVTELTAVPSDRKVGVSWRPPAHPELDRVVVVRTIGASAASLNEGEILYEGTGSSALDVSVSNSEVYYYTAFSDYAGVPEEELPLPVSVSARPEVPRIDAAPDTFVDRVASFSPLDPNCFNCASFATIALGPPRGLGDYTGSLDAVSLGARVNDDAGRSAPYGGSIVVEFTDNLVVDGPGPDFIIFENALRLPGTDDYFSEPATVDVSADGVRFYRFPIDFVPHYRSDGTLNLWNPFSYASGFAGVRPVYSNQNSPSPLKPSLAGGDAFDLSDLPGAPLRWIRFIRITSTGDAWLLDRDGDAVRHSNDNPTFGASGRGNSGFDLDAVTAVNY